MDEIWKPAPGLEGVAEVSNLGRVRTLDRDCPVPARTRNGKTQKPGVQRRKGRVLSPDLANNGYRTIAIKTGAVRKKYAVHRLVCLAFNAGYFDGAHVDHVDGNKENNRADNLEFVTASENTRRQWRLGLVNLRGDAHTSSKLSNERASAIKCLADNGFPYALVAEWFGVSAGTVDAIKGRRRWKATLSG